jgi:hypothetical protein
MQIFGLCARCQAADTKHTASTAPATRP